MTGGARRAARALSAAVAVVACSDPTAHGRRAGDAVQLVHDCPIPDVAALGSVNLVLDASVYAPGGESVRADYAWPLTGGPYPAILMIHGGGWSAGSRRDYIFELLRLAGAGYFTASVDYRLAPGARFPAQIEDVRCAVRWLRAASGSLPIDPARIVAVGQSAGGHLASLLGVAADVAGLDGACPYAAQSPAVRGVVAWSAPTDLRRSADLPVATAALVAELLGGAPEERRAAAALASPVVHATPGDAPVLLVHGAVDPLVPPAQGERLRDALRGAGVPATLIELPGVGHEMPLFDSAAVVRVASCTALAFIRARLGS